MIWRILGGPGNTVREAPALLPELRAIVDSCATGDQGAPLDKQVRYGPGPRLGDLALATLCQRLNRTATPLPRHQLHPALRGHAAQRP